MLFKGAGVLFYHVDRNSRLKIHLVRRIKKTSFCKILSERRKYTGESFLKSYYWSARQYIFQKNHSNKFSLYGDQWYDTKIHSFFNCAYHAVLDQSFSESGCRRGSCYVFNHESDIVLDLVKEYGKNYYCSPGFDGELQTNFFFKQWQTFLIEIPLIPDQENWPHLNDDFTDAGWYELDQLQELKLHEFILPLVRILISRIYTLNK